jgi:hypothetical protein
MSQLLKRSLLVGLLALAPLALQGCDLVRVFFPSSEHESVPPELPAELMSPAVLVFSKTNGFRHDEAIDAGLPVLEEIARKRGWGLFVTENGAVHNSEQLARFDAIVWFQVSGDVLDDEQRIALQDWIRSGGSFFGIHGTGGDSSYSWDWHPETLVGAQFIGHPMGPQFQEATIRIEAPEHPVMRHLDQSWVRTEEWYSFEKSPRGPGVQVLATLDESSYSPRMKIFFMDRDLSMGADHPIIWTHCIGRGHSLYSALGHQSAAYSEPAHLTLLEEGIAWLIRARARDCAIPG